MNAVVSKHLVALIAKQVEERSLVVWYDPGADYKAVAENLEIAGTTVARYDGSFFKLRREIDQLLNGLEPTKLVVYVPIEQASTYHALVEVEAAGVVMQPGQQPYKCNTRLALVARNDLKSLIGDENAAEVEKQVDQGKLTLKDVDALGLKGQERAPAVRSGVPATSKSNSPGTARPTALSSTAIVSSSATAAGSWRSGTELTRRRKRRQRSSSAKTARRGSSRITRAGAAH
jgi:hypothetical protein